MVDPWTAEGIRPGMMGGMKAAEAIANALSGQPDALPKYSEEIEKEMGMEMTISSAIARRFYFQPPPTVEPGSELLRLSARLICGEIGYRQFAMAVAVAGGM